MPPPERRRTVDQLLAKADAWHARLGTSVHDQHTASYYAAAAAIAARAVTRTEGAPAPDTADRRIDALLTSRLVGFPVMLALLAAVFWLTIAGANVPSALLAGLLMEPGGLTEFCAEHFGSTAVPWFLSASLYDGLHRLAAALSAPWWLSGFLVDGVYLALAWVVSVMLPPMAIFFPLFTFFEDVGLLPRVAFNLDRFFRAVGAHGKQALTMAMGFGCNAAGVIACRIIDSPRERLVAILTNTFGPCNGRWPTLILMASLLSAAGTSAAMGSLVSVVALTTATLLGLAVTLLVSWFLSRTLLRGVASSFTLELPPYRRPQLGRILYTSLVDRTLFVLWRAMQTAAPAGAAIWILANIPYGDVNLAQAIANWLQPFGYLLGLDGVILLAYIIAIPANEIVVPTMMMVYMGAGMMIDGPTTNEAIRALLVDGHGWSMLTAVNLMLFSLLHNPCGTTIVTIYKETKSLKWATLSVVLTLGMAFLVTFLVATLTRLLL